MIKHGREQQAPCYTCGPTCQNFSRSQTSWQSCVTDTYRPEDFWVSEVERAGVHAAQGQEEQGALGHYVATQLQIIRRLPAHTHTHSTQHPVWHVGLCLWRSRVGKLVPSHLAGPSKHLDMIKKAGWMMLCLTLSRTVYKRTSPLSERLCSSPIEAGKCCLLVIACPGAQSVACGCK